MHTVVNLPVYICKLNNFNSDLMLVIKIPGSKFLTLDWIIRCIRLTTVLSFANVINIVYAIINIALKIHGIKISPCKEFQVKISGYTVSITIVCHTHQCSYTMYMELPRPQLSPSVY